MFKKIKVFYVLLLILLINACSSIPLSTMLKFANYDEQHLTTLTPAEIRAKITLNSFLNIDLEGTKLGVNIENASGQLALEFPLTILTTSQNPEKKQLFFSSPASQTYLLKLSPAAINDFKTLQQQLESSQQSKFGFSVDAKLKKNEDLSDEQQQQALFITVELKLSNDEGFFTLIDNVEINDAIK